MHEKIIMYKILGQYSHLYVLSFFLVQKPVFETPDLRFLLCKLIFISVTQINIMSFSKGSQSPDNSENNYCLEPL